MKTLSIAVILLASSITVAFAQSNCGSCPELIHVPSPDYPPIKQSILPAPIRSGTTVFDRERAQPAVRPLPPELQAQADAIAAEQQTTSSPLPAEVRAELVKRGLVTVDAQAMQRLVKAINELAMSGR